MDLFTPKIKIRASSFLKKKLMRWHAKVQNKQKFNLVAIYRCRCEFLDI